MSLEKRENDNISSSEEQPVCLEHQCSKRYLFSMLQDAPQQEYFPTSVPCLYDVNNHRNTYVQVDENIKTNVGQLVMHIGNQYGCQPSSQSNFINSFLDSSACEVSQNTASLESHQNTFMQTKKIDCNKNGQDQFDDAGEHNSLEIYGIKPDETVKSYDIGNTKYMHKKGRKMGPRCNCRLSARSAKFHCNEFAEEERQALFNLFWGSMDWHQRKLYISSLVRCCYPSARRKDCQDPHRKEFAFQYHMKKNNKLFRVCKVMFINTFSIGEFSVRDWAMHSSKQLTL
ncbi:unnamed protein product [Larinioides sclopetarius]|uniref:Uncharacterized protein n=1 Tax=Larinioides sclopetarius TaxID=280406 RepID=A0AAV2AVP6_9ARAC